MAKIRHVTLIEEFEDTKWVIWSCKSKSFILAIVLSVLLWFTASDYPFGIFKLLYQCGMLYVGHCVVCPSLIYSFKLPLWYLQTLLLRTKLAEMFMRSSVVTGNGCLTDWHFENLLLSNGSYLKWELKMESHHCKDKKVIRKHKELSIIKETIVSSNYIEQYWRKISPKSPSFRISVWF
jgi:hypothetical protein